MAGRTASDLREIAAAIDAETRRRNLPLVRARLERERGDAVTAAEAAANGAAANGAAPDVPCRTDGCPYRANTRYTRGPYSRLCEEVCIPARRVELSATLSAVAAKRRSAPPTEYPPRGIADPPAFEEPPELPVVVARDPWEVLDGRAAPSEPGEGSTAPSMPDPGPLDAAPPEPPTLAEVADALERARAARDDAESAYEQAVERFLAHPVVRELDVGYQPSE